MGCANTLPYRFVEGDTLPDLACRLSRTDLTGGSVELVLVQPDQTVVTKLGVLDFPADGRFRFQWDPTDLVSGRSRCQITITNGSGDVVTTPEFYIDVGERLA